MKEVWVICGGVYTIALIVFHILFWKIFRWSKSLEQLDRVNRSTMQVLNISITYIFFIFAYLSLVHTDDLINTGLGRTLLVLISTLWLFRAAQQIVFYSGRHRASIALTAWFVVGAILYGVPAVT